MAHIAVRTVQVEPPDGAWETPCVCDPSVGYVGATREQSRAACKRHVAQALAAERGPAEDGP
jgi:hypothetical protein